LLFHSRIFNASRTMSSTSKTDLQIKCPHCGSRFSPEVALEHDLRLHLEKEFERKLEEQARLMEQRIRKVEADKYQTRIRAIEADREEKAARLLALEEKTVTYEERERQIQEREANIDLELRERLLDREKL